MTTRIEGLELYEKMLKTDSNIKVYFLLRVNSDIARLVRYFTKCAKIDSPGCQLRSEGESIKEINNIRMQSSTAASQG
jgi:hypothetical protein